MILIAFCWDVSCFLISSLTSRVSKPEVDFQMELNREEWKLLMSTCCTLNVARYGLGFILPWKGVGPNWTILWLMVVCSFLVMTTLEKTTTARHRTNKERIWGRQFRISQFCFLKWGRCLGKLYHEQGNCKCLLAKWNMPKSPRHFRKCCPRFTSVSFLFPPLICIVCCKKQYKSIYSNSAKIKLLFLH